MVMKVPTKHSTVLSLLAVLMVSHLTFLGINAKDSENGPAVFQKASETYVTILLALLTPLAPK
jgi:hypothetical protein